MISKISMRMLIFERYFLDFLNIFYDQSLNYASACNILTNMRVSIFKKNINDNYWIYHGRQKCS